MKSRLKVSVGEKFNWQLTANGSVSGQATVMSVKTDREEGLAPEAQDYVAEWIEARGTRGERKGETFTVMLGSDSKSYLDGQEITVLAVD